MEWVETEFKLESLPQCGTPSPTAIAAGVTDFADSWDKILANPDIYIEPGTAGAWSHLVYTDLKKDGVESKLIYYPKVTRTTYHFMKPADLGTLCGFQVDNPAGGGWEAFATTPYGAPWKWLQGEDSPTRTGRLYERRTVWTGAEKLPAALYPTAP